ncbi:T9SS type A sorting domain-containing protein [Lewinella sp. IMCC34191]|uniref:T9SS type A sorting domain-containing protein n=1 Tax=Lewinella sp. IMCC34191 TaxID=2259172 RepID=UPI001300B29B|nr:T9SS type A sorting domain-containing protein [Lewinella sp. IMCC34191]
MPLSYQAKTSAAQRLLLTATLLLIGLTQLPAQLSGTYTIGGFKPDYPTIGAAVAELNSAGISGPVLFLIRSGIYQEQVTLSSVNGASKYHTITFKSESGNAADVVVRYYPTYSNGGYVLRFVGGRYYRILDITLESTNPVRTRVIQAYGQGINSVLIQGCRLLASAYNLNDYQLSVITLRADYAKDVHIRDNLIRGGTGAIHIFGGTTSQSTGTEITDNRISTFGYQAVFLSGLQGGKFTGNQIIGSARGTAPSKGVNFIDWNGTATTPVLVANNFVAMPRSSRDALIVGSSSHINIYHNSVELVGSGWGFILSESQFVAVKNNIFKSVGGYAVDVSGCTDLAMNYNDLFTSGGPLGTYGSKVASNLLEWRLFSSQDQRSISADPGFVSYKDLHATATVLLGAGVLVPGVKVDIDGDLRPKPPCIGADEFKKSRYIPFYPKYALSAKTPGTVSVFPNPVSDQLNVTLDDTYLGETYLTVTDALGRRLYDARYQMEEHSLRAELPVADLPAGVYYLHVSAGDRETVKQFIKQ